MPGGGSYYPVSARTGIFMSSNPIRLRLPQANLQRFTVFELSPEGAQGWVDSLPLANSRLAAQHLRHAINDLNRFDLSPELRFNLLEIMRPNLLVVLSNLSKQFLNRPLVMQEQARQTAELADALYDLAATGYALVAVQTIRDSSAVSGFNPARLVCEAVHRGISFCGRNILQAFQLYQPVEVNLWLTLHQLFSLAARQQLTRLPVSDPLTGSNSIEQAYLQAVILACCKPNQLRQSDLAGIYRGMQDWSEHIQLGDRKGMFLVDLGSDAPPMYSSMFQGELGPNHRFIDTGGLLRELETLRDVCTRQGRPGIQFDARDSVPCNIIDHLLLSLGTMSMRHFSRVPSEGQLSLGVGLSSAHYHVAGERSFSELLYGDYDSQAARAHHFQNPFLQDDDETAEEQEAGEQTGGGEGYIVVEEFGTASWLRAEDDSADNNQRYPLHSVRVVDASPGGYGLQWPADLIPDLKAGNLLCMRESEQDNWSIAAVRWVRQPDKNQTQAGVELLSPGARPYGALIHHTNGSESEPLRVLLLPEIQLVGQPHTLITPRAGFREQQKVTLLCEGEEFLIQLTRQVALTGSFARFDFRYIKQLEEVLAENRSAPVDSYYDSVWNNI